MRRGRKVLMIGGLAGMACLGGAARPLAHRALFPGAETEILETGTLEAMFPGAERIELRSGDGAELAMLWVPRTSTRPAASLSENGEGGVAVYFHATNQAAADAMWFARDLAAGGLDVCVPEHRGYGGLAGEPSVRAILEDAEAALAACPGAGRRVLVGRSLGAGVAAEMARRGQGDALVLISPFTSLREVAAPFGWALSPEDRLDARAALREVRVPVTVVHGTGDRLIPFRMGQELAALSGARWIPLSGAGHNDLFLGNARTRLLDAVCDAARTPATSTRPTASLSENGG